MPERDQRYDKRMHIRDDGREDGDEPTSRDIARDDEPTNRLGGEKGADTRNTIHELSTKDATIETDREEEFFDTQSLETIFHIHRLREEWKKLEPMIAYRREAIHAMPAQALLMLEKDLYAHKEKMKGLSEAAHDISSHPLAISEKQMREMVRSLPEEMRRKQKEFAMTTLQRFVHDCEIGLGRCDALIDMVQRRRKEIIASEEPTNRDRMYVRKQERNIDRTREEIRNHFWPEGIKSPMAQGQIGDCYALAALHCVKQYKDGERLLLDMIDRDQRVHFFDPDKGRREIVQVTEADIADKKYRTKGVRGALGDKIIERAFLRFIHKKRGGQKDATMQEQLRKKHGKTQKKLLSEGGYIPEALYYFVGRDFQKFRARSEEEKREMLEALYADRASGARELMVTAASKETSELTVLQKIKKAISFFNSIVANHAYVVENVDFTRNAVTLINPHNTRYPETISIETFLEYFAEIYAVKKAEEATVGHDRTILGVPSIL